MWAVSDGFEHVLSISGGGGISFMWWLRGLLRAFDQLKDLWRYEITVWTVDDYSEPCNSDIDLDIFLIRALLIRFCNIFEASSFPLFSQVLEC